MTGHQQGRTPWMLLAGSALVQAATFLLRPAATYEALDLGAPAFTLGVLAAAFAVVPLFLAVPLGRRVDIFGERGTMVTGTVVIVLASALFLFGPSSILNVIAATGLLGAGHLACVVGQQAVIANTYTSLRLDAMFGYYTFTASLGQIIGPLLIVFTGGDSATPPTQPIFLASLGLSLGLFVTTLFTPVPGGQREQAKEQARNGSVIDLIRTPGVMNALVVSGVILAAIDLLLIYLPALGAERGLAASVVGGLLALRAGFSMLSRLVLVRLTLWLGRTRLLVGSVLLSAVALAVVPIPMHTAALAVTMAVLGVGLGVGQPVTMAWLSQAAPEGQRGRALSLRLAGNRLGQFLVPPLLGTVAAGLGASGVLWTLAAGVGTTAVLLRKANLGDPRNDDR